MATGIHRNTYLTLYMVCSGSALNMIGLYNRNGAWYTLSKQWIVWRCIHSLLSCVKWTCTVSTHISHFTNPLGYYAQAQSVYQASPQEEGAWGQGYMHSWVKFLGERTLAWTLAQTLYLPLPSAVEMQDHSLSSAGLQKWVCWQKPIRRLSFVWLECLISCCNEEISDYTFWNKERPAVLKIKPWTPGLCSQCSAAIVCSIPCANSNTRLFWCWPASTINIYSRGQIKVYVLYLCYNHSIVWIIFRNGVNPGTM